MINNQYEDDLNAETNKFKIIFNKNQFISNTLLFYQYPKDSVDNNKLKPFYDFPTIRHQ